MLRCTGRVVVMGMGKSGHVGRKIAATLASTGTPALFVHPAEASHGDLGMVTPGDVVLAISNSGESDELERHPAGAQAPGHDAGGHDRPRRDRRWPAMPTSCSTAPSTRRPARSTSRPPPAPPRRWRWATRWPWPCSTPAVSSEEDFARSHPGGSLGRKLLTHVRDVMRSGDEVPRVRPDTPFTDMMREMTRQGPGRHRGRRPRRPGAGHLHRRRPAPPGRKRPGPARPDGREVMHRKPRTVRADALAVEAADLMEEHRITVRAGGRRGRPAGGRAQHQRPDARQGHLMQPGAVLPARTAAQGAGPAS
jgi:arabinose-5-phosphate isomerase